MYNMFTYIYIYIYMIYVYVMFVCVYIYIYIYIHTSLTCGNIKYESCCKRVFRFSENATAKVSCRS